MGSMQDSRDKATQQRAATSRATTDTRCITSSAGHATSNGSATTNHPEPRPTSDKTLNYLTMAGHICSDINQGAISALLPFLAASGEYSYVALTGLVFAANIASAVIQPLFGWLGDRRHMPWLMALGIFLAGAGIAGMGIASSYPMLAASSVLSGIGVAMFHPDGGRLANLAAGEHKGNGMSIFAVGGNIGFFVGPIMAAAAVSAWGMPGTLVFLAPVTICAAVLLRYNKAFVGLNHKDAAQDVGTGTETAAHERWGSFALAMVVLSARSVLSYGIMAIVPLYLSGVLGQTESVSSLAISVFSITGAVATILSGRTGERVGAVRLTIACLLASAAMLFALQASASVALCFALTAGLAIGVDLFYASLVAHGMGYVPAHLGMASGLTYGVAVAAGGAFEPVLGMAGDTWGLSVALVVLAITAAVGGILAIALHVADKRTQSAR